MRLFHEFHFNGHLNAALKENLICLIQKKDRVVTVRDYLTISLTSALYKIVAKVLAERLKSVMSSIISQAQSAFIKDRQILDHILIANEAVEFYRKKKLKGWLIKLDVEKAFDCVDWGFLEEVLKLKNFDPRWITWIMGCVKDPSFKIMFNGCPTDRIKATRYQARRSFITLSLYSCWGGSDSIG